MSRASRLKYQRIFLPILEPGARPDGTEIYQTVDSRLPYQGILREKPPSTLRIFTFGGSATAGLGFSPNATFARHLERILRSAHPGRSVEVVNLGIVALSAKQVEHLVEDVCSRFEPDLVIVYSGNNEFLEIHAEKCAEANATPLSRARDMVANTNLSRLITSAVYAAPAAPSLADRDFSKDDLRLTQEAIIRDIEMSEQEVTQVVDQYERHIDAIAQAALSHGTPIVLLTVASNWKWRGRSDLPEDWLAELLGTEDLGAEDGYTRSIPLLSRKIKESSNRDRHKWLFKRAMANEKLRSFEASRNDYRAAMNEDPHLRRALDVMNDRVRAVAKRRGAVLLDTVAVLGRSAEHNIIGFGEFYDYVHFTPRGAALVAAEIAREIERRNLVSSGRPFDPSAYARGQIDALNRRTEDFAGVYEWIGFGFDKARIANRDIWKYDEMVAELDVLLEREPDNVRALVYRGNAEFFRVDGAPSAARDYQRALEIGGANSEIEANLETLLRNRSF